MGSGTSTSTCAITLNELLQHPELCKESTYHQIYEGTWTVIECMSCNEPIGDHRRKPLVRTK